MSTTFGRSSGYKVTSSAHSVVYDSTGRVTQFGDKSFSYDARGRLWKVVSPDETTKYYYDSSGMRVVKDYVLNDEDDADIRRVITRYVYSGSNLVAERIQSYSDVEGQTAVKREERNYFWLGMRPVAMGINSYNMIGGLFAKGTWKEYDIVTDRTGRPVMVVNSILNKVWSTKYTPYGISYGTYSGSGFEFNLRQPGQYFDSETGWYYNGQRYYIPEMRRYNRPEPIGQAGSLDLYMYAGGNPVNRIDPTGLFWKELWNGLQDSVLKLEESMYGMMLSAEVASCMNNGQIYCGSAYIGKIHEIQNQRAELYNDSKDNLAAFGLGGIFGTAGQYALFFAGKTPNNALMAERQSTAVAAKVSNASTGGGFSAYNAWSKGSTSGAWLKAQEKAGGHLIARHVGKSQPYLANRLANSPRMPAASTFLNITEAEMAVGRLMKANSSQISSWLSSGANRTLKLEGSFTGGNVLQRGSTSITTGSGMRVILKGNGQGNYHLLTGFPIP